MLPSWTSWAWDSHRQVWTPEALWFSAAAHCAVVFSCSRPPCWLFLSEWDFLLGNAMTSSLQSKWWETGALLKEQRHNSVLTLAHPAHVFWWQDQVSVWTHVSVTSSLTLQSYFTQPEKNGRQDRPRKRRQQKRRKTVYWGKVFKRWRRKHEAQLVSKTEEKRTDVLRKVKNTSTEESGGSGINTVPQTWPRIHIHLQCVL